MSVSPKTQVEAEANTNLVPEITMEIIPETQNLEASKHEFPTESNTSRKRKADDMQEEIENIPEMGINYRDKPASMKKLEKSSEHFVTGLVLNLPWCRSVKLYELLDLFEAQNWVNLLGECFNRSLYVDAMRDFCKSFKYSKGVIRCCVYEKEIEFDAMYLAELFDVPNTGYDLYFKSNVIRNPLPDANIDEIVEFLGGDPEETYINHNDLTPLDKILLKFVFNDIIPRTQKRDSANKLDSVLIYCLAKKIQINFPSIMIQHLSHCVPKGWKVGYGNLLTYVFESFGISFTDKEPLPLKNTEYMQSIFLENHKMKVVDGCFEVVLEEKEKRPKEVGGLAEGEEERATGIIEGVVQDIQEEEEEKVVEEVIETGGRKKRKSLRLMKKKEAPAPICIDITGVQEELQKVTTSPTSGKYASTSGFAAFSSPPKVPSEDVKELKEML